VANSANTPGLRVIGGDAQLHSEERGPLLDAHQVADLIGGVSPEWVRRNVPGKLDLGHSTKRWWRSDVLEWIDSRSE